MTYDFNQQLELGKQGESRLDALFSRWCTVEVVPLEIEREVHYDRVFCCRDGTQRTVEYKTDLMCHKTGNLVVELVSVDTTDTPGWVYSSCADFLVWEVQTVGVVLVAPFTAIRDILDEWKRRFRTVKIKNNGYCTIGLLVPIDVFREVCIFEYQL